MTQPPQYPGQPEYPGQPAGQPGQPGWPPPPPAVHDPFAVQPDPYAPLPTSAPPTSGQPYAQPYAPPTGQIPPTGAFGQPTGQFPPPTGQFPTGPMPPTGPIPQPGMAPPFSGPPAQGYPVYPPQGPEKKKRGLTITLIVLAVVVVLCGGGGAAAYFVVQNNQGTGAPTAVEAVNSFLTAVYKNKSADDALKYVCSSSRNKDKLAARVDEIRKYDSGLSSPTYTWPTPAVEKQSKDEATLAVSVKVITSDEKVAESKYKYIATHSKGWWVCEVTAA
ncbi:Rv0361 family membrane protein [Dactylosporangium sp. CA-233914]|uniref:Rv0361 family membrane protein n=1 Tax=Dactylosporangium sp. CA-233914 TaxID=3239934 RepID=UPI003D90DB6C